MYILFVFRSRQNVNNLFKFSTQIESIYDFWHECIWCEWAVLFSFTNQQSPFAIGFWHIRIETRRFHRCGLVERPSVYATTVTATTAKRKELEKKTEGKNSRNSTNMNRTYTKYKKVTQKVTFPSVRFRFDVALYHHHHHKASQSNCRCFVSVICRWGGYSC